MSLSKVAPVAFKNFILFRHHYLMTKHFPSKGKMREKKQEKRNGQNCINRNKSHHSVNWLPEVICHSWKRINFHSLFSADGRWFIFVWMNYYNGFRWDKQITDHLTGQWRQRRHQSDEKLFAHNFLPRISLIEWSPSFGASLSIGRISFRQSEWIGQSSETEPTATSRQIRLELQILFRT